MVVRINDKFACESKAVYGAATEKTGGMGGAAMGHSHGKSGGAASVSKPKDDGVAIKTITTMTPCVGPFKVKKGDTMTLTAEYDLSAHPLRVTANGVKAADVMGMLGVSFAADQ
jgi:hypothetical protein